MKLENFRYELSERGKTRITVPEGLHDDCVMAVALAAWNLPDKPIPERPFIPQRPFYDRTHDWWRGW